MPIEKAKATDGRLEHLLLGKKDFLFRLVVLRHILHHKGYLCTGFLQDKQQIWSCTHTYLDFLSKCLRSTPPLPDSLHSPSQLQTRISAPGIRERKNESIILRRDSIDKHLACLSWTFTSKQGYRRHRHTASHTWRPIWWRKFCNSIKTQLAWT